MDACVSVISFPSFSFFKKKQENYDLSGYRGQSLLLRIAGIKLDRIEIFPGNISPRGASWKQTLSGTPDNTCQCTFFVAPSNSNSNHTHDHNRQSRRKNSHMARTSEVQLFLFLISYHLSSWVKPPLLLGFV
jgi:hypothetical protein